MKRNGKNAWAALVSPDQIESRRYMPGLDGLRALAVLAVIAYHLNLPWATGGLLGVCVFFVLSGYLITDILVAQWQSTGKINLLEFWWARARRLLPALFVMLGGVIAWLAFFDPDRLSLLWNDVLAAVFYISNWWSIFHEVSYFESFGPPSPLGHLWSLAVEEQFYLFWPLLLGLGLYLIKKRRRLLGVTVFLALLSAAAMALIYQSGVDPSRVYYGTDTRAFALLIGAALALVWPSRQLTVELSRRYRFRLDAVGGAALLLIIFMIWQSNQYQASLYYGGLIFFSLVSAVLVAVLAHPGSYLGKIFAMQPWRWLGMLSYGIYLWHYPVIVLTGSGGNSGGFNIFGAVLQIILCIALAAISYHCIENPIRCGTWKYWGQLGRNPRRRQHRFLSLQGRVALTNSLIIFVVFMVVVSGCSMISHAQQQNLAPPQADNIKLIIETEQQNNNGQAGSSAPTAGSSGAEMQPIGQNAIVNQNIPEAPLPDIDSVEVFSGVGITAIGDSVMVEIESELNKLFPGIIVDGKVGRQMHQAPQTIKNLKERGDLGHTVILELGANGAFTQKQFADILELLGSDRQIVLINTRVPKPWEGVVNQLLAQAAADAPNIKLVDWYAASSGQDNYFYADGVHLQSAGVEAYVLLLAEVLPPHP